MFKKIVKWFDRLEDHTRGWLSRHPILYALVGGAGVIIFWRGIWHTVDFVMYAISDFSGSNSSDLRGMIWWDGPLSIFIGSFILLMTGALVSSFIGNELIMSGIKKEKKIAEKTEEEIVGESASIEKIHAEVKELKKLLTQIGKKMK